jgi:3-hydroxybutyryl-CoA dehydratase
MGKIKVGDTASFAKTITETDIYGFAGISGDFNSAHINQVAAENGPFGDRIAHGMLVGSLISTVLGTKLPGSGTIYLEQNLKFKKPVYIGDTATAIVTVSEIVNEEKGIIKLDTVVKNQKDDTVIEGYAVVMYKE